MADAFKRRLNELFPGENTPASPLDRLSELEDLLNALACEMTKYDLRQCETALQTVRREIGRETGRRNGNDDDGGNETNADTATSSNDDELLLALTGSSSSSSRTLPRPSTGLPPPTAALLSNENSLKPNNTTASDIPKTIVYKDLVDAVIHVEERCGDLRLAGLVRCVVEVDHPIRGASHISNCAGCKFRFATHQLRVHDTVDCDFLLDVATSAVIERCKRLRFCDVTANASSWTSRVNDMSCFRKPSPNYAIVTRAEDMEFPPSR